MLVASNIPRRPIINAERSYGQRTLLATTYTCGFLLEPSSTLSHVQNVVRRLGSRAASYHAAGCSITMASKFVHCVKCSHRSPCRHATRTMPNTAACGSTPAINAVQHSGTSLQESRILQFASQKRAVIATRDRTATGHPKQGYLVCILTMHYDFYREHNPSVSVPPRRTLCADDAAEGPSTSSTRVSPEHQPISTTDPNSSDNMLPSLQPARRADTPLLRSAHTSGARRLSAERLPVPARCLTSRYGPIPLSLFHSPTLD